MTTPRRCSASRHIEIRGLRYHLREWGARGAPQLFMLHGWLDASASFQFVVDALQGEWHVIAPDWRGCGLSERPAGASGYHFIDLLADLDHIVEHCKTSPTVNLIGHSMGANVACHYAGMRAELVRRVVSLEGFGPLLRAEDMPPLQAPARLTQWLDDIRNIQPFKRFASEADTIAEIRRKNPRLSERQAEFLSAHWFERGADGHWQNRGDPAYKVREPGRYRAAEVDAVWAAVAAPVLHVAAVDSAGTDRPVAEDSERFKLRLRAFRDFREVLVEDSGHMVHHDQPGKAAALIEAFCH